MKIIKGDYDYLNKKRKRVVIWTIFCFALALSIFFIGYITTGTKRNLLTVVAILGCLPACKNLVSMIMYLKAKGCSKEAHIKIEDNIGNLISMYDMYFTSYSKNYNISHMIVNKKVILGYTEDVNFDKKGCIDHLTSMLKNAGYNNLTISISDDIDKYSSMLSSVDSNLTDSEISKDDEIRISLYEISL